MSATAKAPVLPATPTKARGHRSSSVAESVRNAVHSPSPTPTGRGHAPCSCGGSCPRCQGSLSADFSSAPVPSSVAQTLASPGSPLSSSQRQRFEPHFQKDFSSVQIHHDPRSAQSADAIDAAAYSYSSHIVLGSRYDRMAASEKNHLLGHELNHVAESKGAATDGPLEIEDDAGTEARANLTADRIGQNKSAITSPQSRERIRCQPTHAAAKVKYPGPIQVGSETILVASAAEDKEARQLIADIKTDYGITLDSAKGKSVVQSSVVGDPYQPQSLTDSLLNKPREKVKDLVTASSWTLQQLRDLKKGLEFFRKILGPQRALTNILNNSMAPQPITSMSRVSTGLDDSNTAADPNVYGQFFSLSDHAAFFDSAKSSTKLADPKNQFMGIVVHEMAHALMPPGLFLTGLTPAYWQDAKTRTKDPGAENPITNYGASKASEDMAEATMFYFVEPATLKASCPKRYALVEQAATALLNPTPPKGPSPTSPNP